MAALQGMEGDKFKKCSNVFSAILEIKRSNNSGIQIQIHPGEDQKDKK